MMTAFSLVDMKWQLAVSGLFFLSAVGTLALCVCRVITRGSGWRLHAVRLFFDLMALGLCLSSAVTNPEKRLFIFVPVVFVYIIAAISLSITAHGLCIVMGRYGEVIRRLKWRRARDEEALLIKRRVHNDNASCLVSIQEIMENGGNIDLDAQVEAIKKAVGYLEL